MESDDDIAYAENGTHRAIAKQKSTKASHSAVIPARRRRVSSEAEPGSSPLNSSDDMPGADAAVKGTTIGTRTTAGTENADFDLSSYASSVRSVGPWKLPVATGSGRAGLASGRGEIMFTGATSSGNEGLSAGRGSDGASFSQMNELLKSAGSTVSGTTARPRSISPASIPAVQLDRPAHWKKRKVSPPRGAKRIPVPTTTGPVRVNVAPRNNGYAAPRGRAQPDPNASAKMLQSSADAATLLSNGFGLSWLSQAPGMGSGPGSGGWGHRQSSRAAPEDDIQEAEQVRSRSTGSIFAEEDSIAGLASPAGDRLSLNLGLGPSGSACPDTVHGSGSKSRSSAGSALTVRFQNICKRSLRDEARLAALLSAAGVGDSRAAAGPAMMDPRRKFRVCVELELLRDACVAGGVFLAAPCTVSEVRVAKARSVAAADCPAQSSTSSPLCLDKNVGATANDEGNPGLAEVAMGLDFIAGRVAPVTPGVDGQFDLARDFGGVDCVVFFKLDTNRDKRLFAGSRCCVYDPVVLERVGELGAAFAHLDSDVLSDRQSSKQCIAVIATYLMEMV